MNGAFSTPRFESPVRTTSRLASRTTGENPMTSRVALVLTVVLLAGGIAQASDLDLTVRARGFESSTIVVGTECEIGYRIIAELSDAENQGLASFAVDLDYTGGALSPADDPSGLPMTAFSPPNGLSNPAGFGGTPEGGRLLQVGGSQNVIMHGQWSCEVNDDCPGTSVCAAGVCSAISGLPLGEVVPDIASPGSPVSLVTGSLVTPAVPAVYHLTAVNPRVGVLESGATGRMYWSTEAAGITSVVPLTISVVAGASCEAAAGACCLPSGLCASALPDECIYVLGGVTHGSGTVCEGDLDGDGIDGTCGDLCPEDPLKLDPGICGCGVEDDPTDSDGDTVPDCIDQCPGQDDRIDLNGNGIPDCLEQQPAIPTASPLGLVFFAFLIALSAAVLLGLRRSPIG